jgi:hypothetical protein
MLYTHNIRAARVRVRDYNNTALQQAAAELEYLYSRQCYYNSSALLQVAVLVGQAKDYTMFLAAVARTGNSSILNVSAAV